MEKKQEIEYFIDKSKSWLEKWNKLVATKNR